MTSAVTVMETDRWEFFPDAAGRWVWRRIAPSGRIVGAARRGYETKQACVANARQYGYAE